MTDKATSGQNVPNMAEGLYLMDGIKGLLSLPQHSVDMLLTDPPYGTTRNYWDVPLPLPELWEAVKWAVKPNGAVLFFAQCPYDKVLGASNLSMLRYEWVWYKERGTGFLNANRAPLKKSENILVFYQKSPVYHPQFTYCRVAHDDSFALEHQRFLLQLYAKQAGYTIIGAADEYGSGLTLDRPALQKVTEAVVAGRVDVVIVHNLARIGREWGMTQSYIDLLTRHKVKLLCIRDRLLFDENGATPILTIKNAECPL